MRRAALILLALTLCGVGARAQVADGVLQQAVAGEAPEAAGPGVAAAAPPLSGARRMVGSRLSTLPAQMRCPKYSTPRP